MVVGLGVVLQQTPLSVTVPPPSEITTPPLVALVWEILVTGVVVTVERTAQLKVLFVIDVVIECPQKL
jgi:hypothetical protein